MAENYLKVVVLTPYKKLVDISDVTEIYFPAGYGVIGVFPEHAPLKTTIGTGVVVYTHGDISGILKVTGGIAEIKNNTVTLIVDVGEEAASIDLERARRALERAESRLSAKELGNIEVKRAEEAKARALARIEAAEWYRNRMTSFKDKKN